MLDAQSPATKVDTVLSVRNLSVHFETNRGLVEAVRDVSFDLEAGKTLAILGESGSGKSVTAATIMGLLDMPPAKIAGGSVSYRGTNLLTLNKPARRALYGSKLAMVFQDPLAALNPLYTVGWQVAETFRLHGFSKSEAREKTLQLLEQVGIPDPQQRIDAYPHQLSGGQRQRVVIAMAVGLGPDVLVADEPTSALDVTVQARILRLLKDIQRRNGMALMLITHDLGVAAQMADHVVVMQNGLVVEQGAVDDIINRPAHVYTRKLLAAMPGRGESAGFDDRADVLMSAESVSKIYNLRRPFGGGGKIIEAMRDVSFTLHKGECLGIIGESGSGKSTLARLLLKLEKPTDGQVAYRGVDIAKLAGKGEFEFRRRVQAVFQDPTASLNPFMSVERIISEPWEIHADVVPRADRPARVRTLLEQVGLEPQHATRYPHQFSGGQRQRIAIARALALNPEIIVCDEAVSALDMSVQSQIISLLKKLRAEQNLTYIFIAHDLGVVRDFCDNVLVMHRGVIVEHGPTASVFDAPQHAYTRELLAASPSANLSGRGGSQL